MGNAITVAARRTDLVEKAMNDLHQAVIDGHSNTAKRRGDYSFSSFGYTTERFCLDMQQTAARAELFTASTDMQELAETIARELPAQSFELFDLPTDHGYLHLPTPFVVRDIRAEPLHVTTIMWSRRTSTTKETGRKVEGFALWMFTDMGGPDDPLVGQLTPDAIDQLVMNCPTDSFLAWHFIQFGKDLWTYEDTDQGSRDNYDRWKEQQDESTYTPNGDGSFTCTTPNGATVIRRPDPLLQFLQTYWLLCQSELTDMEQEPLPRQFKRAMERKQMPSGPVTVVVLRKKRSGVKGVGGGWTLEYRYVRRAHTRLQWYGSGDAKFQKRILIAPCVVGPDGAPWRQTPVVNVLAR